VKPEETAYLRRRESDQEKRKAEQSRGRMRRGKQGEKTKNI
jgi:hypothetical protein